MSTQSSDVFLSVEPDYGTELLDYLKAYEYRRSPPAQEPPYRMVIYATGDRQEVLGEVVVDAHTELPVDELAEQTAVYTTSTPEVVREYFEGKDRGTALHVTDREWYPEPIPMSDIQAVDPDFTAPQNFRYLKEERDDAVLDLLSSGGLATA